MFQKIAQQGSLILEMERPTSSVMRNLSGYILPPDSLFEIRALLMKRYQSPFSDGLSAEARLAMKQVLEEDTSIRPESRRENAPSTPKQTEKDRKVEKLTKGRNKTNKENQRLRKSSYSESFAKNATERLEGDLTDENYNSENLKKKAIGGKLESAMETIEIVKHGEPETPADIDSARKNSVEKCLVWMEVNGDVDESVKTSVVGRYNTSV